MFALSSGALVGGGGYPPPAVVRVQLGDGAAGAVQLVRGAAGAGCSWRRCGLWLWLWPGEDTIMLWAVGVLAVVVVAWAVVVGLGLGVWPGLGCAMAWAVGVTVTRSSG